MKIIRKKYNWTKRGKKNKNKSIYAVRKIRSDLILKCKVAENVHDMKKDMKFFLSKSCFFSQLYPQKYKFVNRLFQMIQRRKKVIKNIKLSVKFPNFEKLMIFKLS